MVTRVRAIFSGRVHGVGFRAGAHAAAQGFRVVGFVRNERDGSVCLEAQGELAQVEGLLAEVANRMARNITATVRSSIVLREGERAFVIER